MIPKHIAIIMDGNGRWAEARHRHRAFGHIKGAKVAREIIQYATERNIKYLTLFTFSTENWRRPQTEINLLMRLLNRHLVRERDTLMKENIRFKSIGLLEQLPAEIIKEVQHNIDLTANNTGMELTLALNYGGQSDIVQATRKIAVQIKEEKIQINDINEDLLSRHLWTHPTPSPDLIIRTSGEMRLSNFLLWQCAYSEMYFTDVNWPDFTKKHLYQALAAFRKRHRRFGSITQKQTPSFVEGTVQNNDDFY